MVEVVDLALLEAEAAASGARVATLAVCGVAPVTADLSHGSTLAGWLAGTAAAGTAAAGGAYWQDTLEAN